MAAVYRAVRSSGVLWLRSVASTATTPSTMTRSSFSSTRDSDQEKR